MKKTLALALVLFTILSLTGCGNSTKQSNISESYDDLLNQIESEVDNALSSLESKDDDNEIHSEEDIYSEEDIQETDITSNGIRPDFKEAMDAYEAFYDEYCDFMKKYSENPTDLDLILEYTDILATAEEMDEAFDKWESEDLTDEELKYYLEVNTRVMQKLVDVMY